MVSGEEENKRSEVSENQKTDAASEGNANIVCKLPSGEEEGEAKLQSASLRDALAVSARLGWAGFSAGALLCGELPLS
ncbi:hypothetical protein, partial [uncultured Rikenella sp.]|uniref:hypothetical protein n=2 Tax=uncultured Rikenella sp. TaxID=368003 RepID=UPI00261175E5